MTVGGDGGAGAFPSGLSTGASGAGPLGADGGAGGFPPSTPQVAPDPTDHTPGVPEFDQESTNSEVLSGQSGVASLTFGSNVFRFRSNPNAVDWTYELITNIEPTYGGRVVQILGIRLGQLTIKIDCGLGGWGYAMKVVRFMSNMLDWQRTGNTAQFEYTPRNWLLNLYALDVPFQDSYNATVRELALNFQIEEDITGAMKSTSLSQELSRLYDGIGWAPSQYNQPSSDLSGLTTETTPVMPDILPSLESIPLTGQDGTVGGTIGSSMIYGEDTAEENLGSLPSIFGSSGIEAG